MSSSTEYRIGKCTSCKEEFKVPASFSASKAKCKSCGGVVEIGAVQGNSAPKSKPTPSPAKPVPASKPTPKPVAQAKAQAPQAKSTPTAQSSPAAAKPERSGPSMKERLLAERSAGKASPPTKAPAAVQPAVATRTPSAPAKKTELARGSRAARTAKDTDEEGSRSRSSSRERGQKKKKNPLPIVAGFVGIVALGFATWKFVFSGEGKDVQAAPQDAQSDTATPAPADASAQPLTPEQAVGAAQPEAVEPEQGAQPADGLSPDQAAGAASEVAANEPNPPAEAPEASNSDGPATTWSAVPRTGIKDPAQVDWSAVPDFGPAAGTSEEEWAEAQRLAALYLDPLGGRDASRAGITLKELGKKAFPAVLNAFRKIDFSTEQGYRDGDICQRLLMQICNGNNFGWKFSTTVEDQVFNRLAVRSWSVQWDLAKDNEDYWRKMAKLDKQEAAEGESAADEGKANAQQKALDELDLDG